MNGNFQRSAVTSVCGGWGRIAINIFLSFKDTWNIVVVDSIVPTQTYVSRLEDGMFFDLEDGQKVNSMVYGDQILTRPLQEFRQESFGDVQEPIAMEDNAPVHKKVHIPVREKLERRCHQHPPNSPDLNPIENIWVHMKHHISQEYDHITSLKQ